MRGKGNFKFICFDEFRITLAHAGKSCELNKCFVLKWDHPPHMRGKAEKLLHRSAFVRITPAHAGKRSQIFHLSQQGQDHPRTCGEKLSCDVPYNYITGSPPHMRGKGTVALNRGVLFGITPAHAGKRLLNRLHSIPLQDHPRTCGEKP